MREGGRRTKRTRRRRRKRWGEAVVESFQSPLLWGLAAEIGEARVGVGGEKGRWEGWRRTD